MEKFISILSIILLVILSLSSFAVTEYKIEVSHNDKLPNINGERYEAQTYCFNTEEGDTVIFLDGSAYGACATAPCLT